jgi:hypothetical protein
MKSDCPHCHAVLDFGDRPPSFCAFCGHPLGDSKPAAPVVAPPAPIDPEATGPFAFEAATLAPAEGGAETEESLPAVIGNYRLLRALGGGGMGKVYEAEEIGSGRRVALKVISSGFGSSGDAVERFRQEGRLASALVHPRCVFVYAADEEAGRPYIVMELMPGKTLEDLVREKGPLSVADAIEAIMDVIEGLQEAHQLGIIHRDVKPSNCFLEADGRVKVGDFGLAKSLGGGVRLTSTGAFLGTPLYASPEQVRGEKLTVQSDVYSVAATLYFLLGGKAPFESGDAVATLARIVSEDPPPLRSIRPEVPELLDRVILHGLERSRERRYADLEELRLALRPFLPGRSPIVSLGMRFGASVIDHVILALFGVTIGIGSVVTFQSSTPDLPVGFNLTQQLILHVLVAALFFLYYLPEAFLGCSIGKGLLGLRVCRATTTEAPGVWRFLARTTIFYVLLNGGKWLPLFMVATFPAGTVPARPEQLLTSSVLFAVLSLVAVLWSPLGIAVVCSTMRTRNGLRGLHDFLSETRVIARPAKGRRKRLAIEARQPLEQPADLPSVVGPFRVKGALRWTAGEGVLLGEDPGLGRGVLLWLRPTKMPAIDEARRRLSRTSRLRWLSAGKHGEHQYDALLLPPGCTLPALLDAKVALAWEDLRYLLEQLTTELVASREEHNVPVSLSPAQVWVQSNGRVILLDPPLGNGLPRSTVAQEIAPLEEQEEANALLLLREVAARVHSRASAPKQDRQPPLPLHARALLKRLRDEKEGFACLDDLQAELRETRSLPREVTRSRRAAHLAVQVVLLYFGLGCCMLPVGFFPGVALVRGLTFGIGKRQSWVESMDRGSRRDLVPSVLSQDLWVRLTGAALYGAALREQEWTHKRIEAQEQIRKARLAAANPVLLMMMRQGQLSIVEKRDQKVPGPLEAPNDYRKTDPGEWKDAYQEVTAIITGAALGMLSGPILWVLWAFLARGGISFRIAGLALVRRDGRPAGRWQSAWRTLVVWGPVTALLMGSVVLEGWYWATWQVDDPRWWAAWLSRGMWWLGAGMVLGWVVLALRSPSRALHDRLAGTFVVPR